MHNSNRVAALAIGGASVVVSGVGAWLSGLGAHVFAPGEAAIWLAVGAITADFFIKPFWLAGAAAAWRFRAPLAAVMVCLMGVLLHAYSLASAVGLAAAGRDQLVSARGAQQDTKARAEARLTAAQAQAAAVRSTRPVAIVQAELTAAEAMVPPAIWQRTAFCQNATAPASIAACRRVVDLRAEMPAAREGEAARRELAEARAALDGLVAPRATDPQAAALAAYVPVSEDTVAKGLPLMPSLLVEFVPAIGILLATILWRAGEAPTSRKVEVRASVEVAGGERDLETDLLAIIRQGVILNGGEWRAVQAHLAEQMGAPAQTVSDTVRRLRSAGQIEAEREGNKMVYRLPKRAA